MGNRFEKGMSFGQEPESESGESSPLDGFQETTGPTEEQIRASLESESGFECVDGRSYRLGEVDKQNSGT